MYLKWKLNGEWNAGGQTGLSCLCSSILGMDSTGSA